jgi:hypothetical protein
MPGLISKVTIEGELVQVWRGEADVDPHGFEISACSNPKGPTPSGRDMTAANGRCGAASVNATSSRARSSFVLPRRGSHEALEG